MKPAHPPPWHELGPPHASHIKKIPVLTNGLLPWDITRHWLLLVYPHNQDGP